MVVHSPHFLRSIADSVRSGSRAVAEVIRSKLPDCIISMSEMISDVIRGEEIWRRLPEGVVVSEIFRHLPTRDVARARCVCRSWNSLLSSPEFRQLWYVGGSCTDIEQWMGSGSCEPPELRWAAVTHRHCLIPPGRRWAYEEPHRHCEGTPELDIESDSSDRETSSIPLKVPLKDTQELASSHGLVCRSWIWEGRILVGNHRTRKWKLLPPFPGGRYMTPMISAPWASSVRFLRHDLLQQTYILFFLEICRESHQVFTHLYDSRASSWQRISRHPMPRDRFCSGISDGSVVVVGYNCVNSGKELRVQGPRIDEVGILAYDFCDNSWDEITTTLQDHSGDSAAVENGSSQEGICFRQRLHATSGYRINSVLLCANNAKDEYCRLVVVDGNAGVMCLWQLEESCTVFQLVSTVQLRPQRPWSDVKVQYYRNAYIREVANDTLRMKTWIIRSDATLFMAVVMYGPWSWLVIYDVGRSSWLTAHAYGDLSHLQCGLTCCCMWPLLEYDVRWHDHEEKEVLQHDVESPLMPLQGPLPPNRPCAVVAGALGPQPSRRLHLVRVPDIWSTP